MLLPGWRSDPIRFDNDSFAFHPFVSGFLLCCFHFLFFFLFFLFYLLSVFLSFFALGASLLLFAGGSVSKFNGVDYFNFSSLVELWCWLAVAVACFCFSDILIFLLSATSFFFTLFIYQRLFGCYLG